ncbi:MAG: DUF4214 domain-containing protein [Pseudomonadota bacterium]
MRINELRISSPGDSGDTSNFIELSGTPGASLDGLSLLVFSGEFEPGQIEFSFPLDGGAFDGDGLFLLANPADQSGYTFDDSDLEVAFDLFDTPQTVLLVDVFTGIEIADFDTDNDGVLDIEPWDAVLDGVSLVDGDDTEDLSYSAAIFGPDGGGFPPAGLVAIPDGTGQFEILAFDDTGADTPGAPNGLPALPVFNELSVANIVTENGAPPPVSDAGGIVEAGFSFGPADSPAIDFTIQLQGVDLVEDPAERTDPNDVTGIQFRLGGIGENGPNGANAFGFDDSEVAGFEIDYETETISGQWSILTEDLGDDGVRDPEDQVQPASVLDQIEAGELYLEVETVAFSGPDTGELRAQVSVLPMPVIARIYEIQGAGHVSPFIADSFEDWVAADGPESGQRVWTSGIVTAVDGDGFYLQDAAGDEDIATSDAVFVATDGAPDVITGNTVSVTGTVQEIAPGGFDSGNLPTTQVLADSVLVSDAAVAIFPTSTIIGPGGRMAPTEVIDDDAFASFDPQTDGIDFFESLEGMLVQIEPGRAVAATNQFGELFIVPEGTDPTGVNERGGLTITPDDFNPEKIQIDTDPDITPDFETPEVFAFAATGSIEGVVSYSFGNFEVVPTRAFDVEIPEFLVEPGEITQLEGGEGQMSVATFNVLNLDPNDADGDTDIEDGRFDEIARQIVQNLKIPDVIALQEVQDNDGSVDSAEVSAADTLDLLVEAIDRADDGEINGSAAYGWVDNTFITDDASGGQPGGNIRTAFLYRTDRVELVEGSLSGIGGQDEGDPFFDARLPLAADFVFEGETVTLINTHFSSKSGSAPIMGREQPFEQRQEELAVNGGLGERQAQAQAINDFIDQLMMLDFPREYVVLGDMNEFDFVSPVAEMLPGEDPVLTNLAETLDPLERYSFNFQGNAQALDHILVSDRLAVTGAVDYVHSNSEFAAVPGRASDHDPVVAIFAIGANAPRIIPGSDGNDTLVGTEEDDAIGGLGSDDIISASGGSDLINGGAGFDVVGYQTSREALGVTLSADGTISVAKPDGGTDTLRSVERVKFDGGALLYDILGPDTDYVYRTYAASLGRTPDEAGLRFQLSLLEDGLSRIGLANTFVDSLEFESLYGENPTAEDYVDALYLNTLGRVGDEMGRSFWIEAIDGGGLTRADMLIAFAESAENIAQTADDIDNGIFVPSFTPICLACPGLDMF